MNSWLASCLLITCVLSSTLAQEIDWDSESLINALQMMEKRRPASELFGKRSDAASPPEFGREVRRPRELFGKRSVPIDFEEAPEKRRARELFGKRSSDLNGLSVDELLGMFTGQRQRRARGRELFG